MTEYEAYQEHIRYTHDTYCRIVIRHASFDAARMLAARWKREISLELRFIILLLARWTCPNNRPTYPTYLMCRIGTAKFFTLLLLLYHTSVKYYRIKLLF